MKRVPLRLFGALAVGAVLDLQLATAHAQGPAFTILTITNPTPAYEERFGWSVAAVGTDWVLIGAVYDTTRAQPMPGRHICSAPTARC